jgi:hypothetical protein
MRCSNNDLKPEDLNVDSLSKAKSIKLNHPSNSGKSDCKVDWTELPELSLWQKIINPIKKVFKYRKR